MAFGTQDDTDEVMNEINMTPLVDIMLVLLIIFIVTVPVMKHAVNIDLPQASNTRLRNQARDGAAERRRRRQLFLERPVAGRCTAGAAPGRGGCAGTAARAADPRRQERALRTGGRRPWPRHSARACARSDSSPSRSRSDGQRHARMTLSRRPAPPSPPQTGTAASDSGAARGASDHAAQTHAVHSEVPCLDSESLLQGHGSVAIIPSRRHLPPAGDPAGQADPDQIGQGRAFWRQRPSAAMPALAT